MNHITKVFNTFNIVVNKGYNIQRNIVTFIKSDYTSSTLTNSPRTKERV